MNINPSDRPAGPSRPVAVPASAGETTGQPADAAILRFNEMNEANEDLFTRACHGADLARHATDEAERLRAGARRLSDAWRTVQLEHPERRAWLPLMTLIALSLLALDSWAAYFAAEALGGDQKETVLWAVLFLVILGLLEAGLALTAERSRRIFRLVAVGLGLFAALLASLRFGFFAVVGATLVTAILGAVVFTVCTVSFVLGGFAAVRYAETLATWQARRRARKAARKASDADTRANRLAEARDRRIDAYLARMRPMLLGHPDGAQRAEDRIRAHLLGGQP